MASGEELIPSCLDRRYPAQVKGLSGSLPTSRSMRTSTAIAIGALLVIGLGAPTIALAGWFGAGGALDVAWVSETAVDGSVNHHAVAAGPIGPAGTVFAPISSVGGSDQCELAALSGDDGSRLWNYPLPAANCTVHAVADPTVADYDGDGVSEVFVATTEQSVVGLHPRTGDVEFRHPLSAYGYTRPLVVDVLGDEAPEIVAVDVQGSVFVVRANGSVAWSAQGESYTWGQPRVADFDDDGDPELVVGFGGSGELVRYEPDGTVGWRRSAITNGSITWLSTTPARSGGPDLVLATVAGEVVLVDGADGSVIWRRDVGRMAAVHAVGAAEGEGDVAVYAVARDGTLRRFDAADGSTTWTTALTTEANQMTPPPALGDLNGDGDRELVAVTKGGKVAVVDPATGEELASYHRDADIWVHPTVADVDSDGRDEVYVMYGDGRVVALTYSTVALSTSGVGPSGGRDSG